MRREKRNRASAAVVETVFFQQTIFFGDMRQLLHLPDHGVERAGVGAVGRCLHGFCARLGEHVLGLLGCSRGRRNDGGIGHDFVFQLVDGAAVFFGLGFGRDIGLQRSIGGVERLIEGGDDLAKVRVDGSNPFARSKSLSKINGLEPLALFNFPKKVIYGS